MSTTTQTASLNAHERRAILSAATEAITGGAGHSHLVNQVENILAAREERMALVGPAVPLALAERLVASLVSDDCELVGFSGSGRCMEPAVAVRWEDGFADEVCETHAHRAQERGAVVVWAKPQRTGDQRPAWERN